MHTIAFLLLFGLLACGHRSTDSHPDTRIPVALQVDVDHVDAEPLLRICRELERRGIPATLFISLGFAQIPGHQEVVHELYLRGFEIALLSSNLEGRSYDDQGALLRWEAAVVGGCKMCGTDQRMNGMRPAGFVQDESTYQLVDSLGFAYNAGFQAGLLHPPGYASAVWPYRLAGYGFAAVPVSTMRWQGKRVCLSDETCRDLGVGPEEWGDWLIAALDEARARQDPLVSVIRDRITGRKDSPFWSPFLRFLDHAGEQEVRFVTTERLVMEYETR